jgi:hypothetical protein
MWLALITLDVMALCAQKVLDWCDEWREQLEPPNKPIVRMTDQTYEDVTFIVEPPAGSGGSNGSDTANV